MRINSKGFILIETLAVTVFAASIFVFLFKSVAPLMGYYESRLSQMGNIDSVFNNFNLRKFIYRDEYFNTKGSVNCTSTSTTECKSKDNQFAIKDVPSYTLIKCSTSISRSGYSGQDMKKISAIYSVDYCNSLMQQMGAREKNSSGTYKNHYLIFYVKADHLKSDAEDFDDFYNEGISFYKNKSIAMDEYSAAFNDEDTIKLFRSAIDEIVDSDDFTPTNTKGYLIFYYFYHNPMYEANTTEPLHKDSISIVPMTPSNDNTNCFKIQLIPNAYDFYRYSSSSYTSNYYFFHDTFNYNLYMTYKDQSDRVNKCGAAIKNRFDNDLNVAKKYCENVFVNNTQFYTIYKMPTNDTTDTTALNNCKHYFKDKIINGSRMNDSRLTTFCKKRLGNIDLPNDWGNFPDAKFAERVMDLDDVSPEVAIIGYDKTCAKDVIIPTEIYGYPVTMIGYEAFKNTGVRSVSFDRSVMKVVEKNAVSLFDSSAQSRFNSLASGKLY